MEKTTDNAASRKAQATNITSVESVSDLHKYTIVTITGMEREFYNAAMKGNIDFFKGKVEQIESILTPNKNTILHVHFTNYTKSVSETFVEELLGMCPALLLKSNVKNETILHMAARHGHHTVVKKLINFAKVLPKDINEIGAEKRLIRAINDKKDTALHEAARYGHEEVVDILIKEEPNHSYFGKNVDDETPLYIAVERAHWNIVDTMLKNNASPQYNGPKGRTSLHAAVLHDKQEKVISKLLERNLSAAKEADENGWVPLHLAAHCGNSDVVKLLVSKDRSTAYMRDNKGRTALHFAAFSEDSFVMEEILKHCPDCCELVDEKGFNALHYTTIKGDYFGPQRIMEDSPLISNMRNERDDNGNTPLHLLARHAPTLKAYYSHPLLETQISRVDTMACNKYGQTVLDVAVADVPPDSAYKNAMLIKLQAIGARLGGRVSNKHLREKKQKKRPDDSAVVEKDNQDKKYFQEFLAEVRGNLSLVATLIATVTFAAGFTLPGGMIQDGKHEGSPILKYNAAFIAFVITDSLAFVFSTSTVLALFLLTILGKADIENKYASVLEMFGLICACLAMVALGFMIIAFGTGIYAVLGISKGLGVVTLLIVLSFFFIFIILFWSTYVFVSKEERSYDEETSYRGPFYKPDYRLERVGDIQLSHIL